MINLCRPDPDCMYVNILKIPVKYKIVAQHIL